LDGVDVKLAEEGRPIWIRRKTTLDHLVVDLEDLGPRQYIDLT
jgi:hypothetical protein